MICKMKVTNNEVSHTCFKATNQKKSSINVNNNGEYGWPHPKPQEALKNLVGDPSTKIENDVDEIHSAIHPLQAWPQPNLSNM